ncbi:SRPBCC family protein [Kribbella sp.]|uniref:SRPBCC family protein n=1 Tax=Kribbella sp. TaxID=1871183 RepID=UPI002D5D48E4|nr:SRPBCC family protein [Kribbella sp.]HZX08079.1 SRPBCC family protein [Kribbella sp.]
MDRGTYVDHHGRPAVRFERSYPYPLERVWSAVTDPRELEHWFPSAVELEPRVGGKVVFSGDPNVEDGTGEVLTYEPPHRIAFTWGDNELHLDLRSTPEGCTLTLVDVLGNRDEAARNGAGWHVCLDELSKSLDGTTSAGPHSDTATEWQPLYDEYVAAGMPHGAAIPTGDER